MEKYLLSALLITVSLTASSEELESSTLAEQLQLKEGVDRSRKRASSFDRTRELRKKNLTPASFLCSSAVKAIEGIRSTSLPNNFSCISEGDLEINRFDRFVSKELSEGIPCNFIPGREFMIKRRQEYEKVTGKYGKSLVIFTLTKRENPPFSLINDDDNFDLVPQKNN